MKKVLTVEQIQNTDDLGAEWHAMPPAFGEDVGVYIRIMRADEASEIEDKVTGDDIPPGEFRRLVLERTVVDENNVPLFDAETISVLMKKSRPTVEEVFDKACQINGLTRAEVDELEGNSESTPAS